MTERKRQPPHARRLASLAFALLLALVPASGVWAQGADLTRRPETAPAKAQRNSRGKSTERSTTAAPAQAPRPRLVLLIAVDQFRYDYLERFGDLFVENGLRRLLRDGASWTQTNYDHIPTETAPGHATMMTGTWPAETGIIGNTWYDREQGRVVNNVADTQSKLIGGGDGRAVFKPAQPPRLNRRRRAEACYERAREGRGRLC